MTPCLQGRVAQAAWLKSRPIAYLVGRGDAAWGDNPPLPTGNETALVEPIALVRASIIEFVTPDAAGLVVLADGSRWTMTATPTPYLYVYMQLEYSDLSTETLREFGLVIDHVVDAAVPLGQRCVPIASVTNRGALYGLERMPPQERMHSQFGLGEVIEL